MRVFRVGFFSSELNIFLDIKHIKNVLTRVVGDLSCSTILGTKERQRGKKQNIKQSRVIKQNGS